MTTKERIEALVKSLYCGEVPVDMWTLLFDEKMRVFANECYEEAAMVAENGEDDIENYVGPCIAKRIRALKDK